MTTGAIKGAEVGFSNSEVPTQWLGCCGYDFKREEESKEFTNMYSPRSPPPLIDTDKCCLPPYPVSPERVWSVLPLPPPWNPSTCHSACPLPRVDGPCLFRDTHLHRCWRDTSLTRRGLERSVRVVVNPEGTRCNGSAVQIIRYHCRFGRLSFFLYRPPGE